MCKKCEDYILSKVGKNDLLPTARGIRFRIVSTSGDLIIIRPSTGKDRAIHLSHIADIYHAMKFDGRVVQGVGSATDSVRGLVGEEGDLVACNICERESGLHLGYSGFIAGCKKGEKHAMDQIAGNEE